MASKITREALLHICSTWVTNENGHNCNDDYVASSQQLVCLSHPSTHLESFIWHCYGDFTMTSFHLGLHCLSKYLFMGVHWSSIQTV